MRIAPVSGQSLTSAIKRVSICGETFRSSQPKGFPFAGLLKSCFGFYRVTQTRQTCALKAWIFGKSGPTKNTPNALDASQAISDLSTVIYGVRSEDTILSTTASIKLRVWSTKSKLTLIRAV